MFNSVAYNFFKDDEDALKTFDLIFQESDNTMDNEYSELLTFSCFGSYGRRWNGIDPAEKYSKKYYFALGARTDQIEKAANYFNEHFKNVRIRILKKYVNYQVAGNSWYGDKYYSENGFKKLVDPKLKDTYYIYVLNIYFSAEYNDLTKYALTIPLGFWIRMFSGYYGCLDVENFKNKFAENELDSSSVDFTNYINTALEYGNRSSDRAGYISDYTVSEELFYKMDDVALSNKLFSKALYGIPYMEYDEKNIVFGDPVKPYCVYYVYEHNGKK